MLLFCENLWIFHFMQICNFHINATPNNKSLYLIYLEVVSRSSTNIQWIHLIPSKFFQYKYSLLYFHLNLKQKVEKLWMGLKKYIISSQVNRIWTKIWKTLRIFHYWTISKTLYYRYSDMNHLVLKIRETLNKCLEYFKYNKNDPYECIRIIEQFTVSNYLFVSESIDDYLSGKRLIKRRFIIIILQLCIWTYTLKCLFISYYNNRFFL